MGFAYKYATGNHAHQIPTILKFSNPALYPNDIIFKTIIENSLYYRIVGSIIKYISLEIILLIIYIIASAIFLISVYKITEYLFKSKIRCKRGLL